MPEPLRVLTVLRSMLAICVLAAPSLGFRLFRMQSGGPATLLGRMFAVRNGVLAAGLLRLDKTTSPRLFVRINVLVDLVDLAAILAAGRRREISTASTVLASGVAVTAVALGAAGQAAMAPDGRLPRCCTAAPCPRPVGAAASVA